MNRTLRLVWLHLIMSLLVVLHFARFMWSMPEHYAHALLLAFISLVLAVCMESIV